MIDGRTEKTDWLTDQENILKFKYVLVAFDSLQFECMIIEEEVEKMHKNNEHERKLKTRNGMKWNDTWGVINEYFILFSLDLRIDDVKSFLLKTKKT